jgi:penicillin-binding protein 1A
MKRLFKLLIKAIIVLIILLLVFCGGFFITVYNGVFGPFPTTAELESIHNEEASLIFASDGSLIGKLFAENRTNVLWKDIPQHLTEALISTEDKRYFSHDGYDGKSYLRVFVKTIILGDKSSGGGSTLTQQLVKNLYGRNDHSFMSMPVNKLKEAIIATRLEDVFSKQEILLLYLNSVPFGEEVYGIEAASLRYFDKHCSELNIQESAVLVGILKANTYYNPRLHPENALKRRNQVITLMFNESYITSKELDSLINMPLELSYANLQRKSPAGYFVYQVKKRVKQLLEDVVGPNGENYDITKDGLKIYTTLDIAVQESAQKAIKKQLVSMQKLLDSELERTGKRKKWENSLSDIGEGDKKDLKNREVFNWTDNNRKNEMSYADSLWHYQKMLNAAVLIAEPSTGRVLTWVGGNNYRYLPYDLILSKRQIASAIKPLIYAAGFEGDILPCDYLSNELVEYEEYDNWKPENYDRSNSKDTMVACWYALAKSMNLPTMDLYFKTGHRNVADMLRRFDLEVPVNETPSIALGALDISLYDIVKAYGAFANYGSIHDELIMIDKITDASGKVIYKGSTQVSITIMEPNLADQITVILEKAVNEGTGKQLRYRYGIKADLAGKTGTAQNYSDAWFLSYTPDLVIGIWVGARTPDIHFQGGRGSGSVLALPIAGEILSDIESNQFLKSRYLSDFQIAYQTTLITDCEPYYEKGLAGFINRVKEKGEKKEEEKSINKDKKSSKQKNKKKKSGIRKFFDKIFKGKKK